MKMTYLAILDILLGIAVFILQITFFALGYTGAPVYISSGFWGGFIFFVTAVVAGSNDPLNRSKIIVMTFISIGTGVFMICFYSVAASNFFDGFCSIYRRCGGFYIEIAFIVSGIFAIIINAVMNVKAKQLRITVQNPLAAYYNNTGFVTGQQQQQQH